MNFVSLRPTHDDHVNLSGSIGSYGTTQSWLNATGTIGKLGYALAGNDSPASRSGESGRVDRAGKQLADLLRQADEEEDAQLPVLRAPRLDDLGDAGLGRISTITSRNAPIVGLSRLHAGRQPRRVAVPSMASPATRRASLVDPAPPAAFRRPPSSPNDVPNPVYGEHVGQGSANFAQSIRAYDAYSRAPLGAGTLLADFYAGDNNVDFSGGRRASRRTTSRTSTSATTKASHGGAASTLASSRSAGTRARNRLRGLGIDGTLAQSINSYFFRGSQQLSEQSAPFGRPLRLQLLDLRQHAELAPGVEPGYWEPRTSCGFRSARVFARRCSQNATSFRRLSSTASLSRTPD